MEFRISDTFTDSLAKLTVDEQKTVKTTAFDLQLNPAMPGMKFHKLERAKDSNFWSVRASGDIRLIVHRTDASILLCYVGHHDDAYDWAERRKLETHPKTGAAQLIELRETVREYVVQKHVVAEKPKPLLFDGISEDRLLGYGVPAEWLEDVRNANEDTLLELAAHLPGEAAEALLNLATGVVPELARPVALGADPFEHPDAQRRFRMMSNVEDLARALDYPWEKWTIFLHPAQRRMVERDYGGPARISGSAGTGKTIVALHRAVFLSRNNPDARVLLTTFSETLANSLRTKLKRLVSNGPRIGERLEVQAITAIGRRLYEGFFGQPRVASRGLIQELLDEISGKVGGHKFSRQFLMMEWEQVVDAWQLESWEAYRDVRRLGRKTRLPEKQRAALWTLFEGVRSALGERGMVTDAHVFTRLATHLDGGKRPPFGHVVVDEAQDVGIPELRFLATLGGDQPNSLFFAGDLGQRIFQQPFSWKALGVDVRGRSSTLRINYRTSHQIRMQADRLLAPELSDVDGNAEERKGTISVFNGPKPTILVLNSPRIEIEAVGKWLSGRKSEGILAHEMGVFVRSATEIERACAALRQSKLPFKVLDDNVDTVSGHVSISTMHLAKGLEFRAVVVMACDDEVIPSQERIEAVGDDADLEEVYDTERHLLYVACTRARDQLLVSGTDPASEFLDDMQG